uniref:Cilia- and flagella-associated protein 97 n=1 Tax=Anopheles farauti TaxID=69004 RepID=A0A1Y9HAF3_9DIPT
MNSQFFHGKTTPETIVGGIRKWEQLSRTSTKQTLAPYGNHDSDHDTLPEDDEDEQYTEQHYSESEFHTEQEDDAESPETEQPGEREMVEANRIEVSQFPPQAYEPENHLLHIDFISNELQRFELPGSGQNRGHRRVPGGSTLGSGLPAKRLPGQQHNMSFSRERVREIERTNQILLRRILSTRPTLQTQAIKPVKSSSASNVTARVTSGALNRSRAQKRIAGENEILLRKVTSVGFSKRAT